MSTGRTELFIFMAAALATTIGLFVAHAWYARFLDVRFHARLQEGGPSEALLAAREAQQQALASGKIPLARAMDQVASKVRPASITPAPSEDLSAVSGWIHRPGFKPAAAFPVRSLAPAKPKPQPTEAAPAAAPAPAVPAEAPTTGRGATGPGRNRANAKPGAQVAQ